MARIGYKIILFLIFISLFLMTFVYRQMIVNDVVKDLNQRNHIIVAQIFSNNVWLSHPEAVQFMLNNPMRDWKNSDKFIGLAKDILGFFQGVDLIKMSLYDSKGVKFISSSSSTINDTPNYGEGIEALKPENLYKRISYKIYDMMFSTRDDFPENIVNSEINAVKTYLIPYANFIAPKTAVTKEGTLVKSLIPITFNRETYNVQAVFEIYTDISQEWETSGIIQIYQFITLFVMMIMSFIIIKYNESKSLKIIDKLHETNVELENAKSLAENQNKEKSKFLANISHELRTPLNAIIGFSDIMKNEAHGPLGATEYKNYINDINLSGSHLLSLINDILDYSKAEADKLQVEKVEVDVGKIMVNSLRLVKPRAEEAKVTLIEEIPKEDIILMADPKRLKQALLNLLSNAVKFTPEGGSVTLSALFNENKSQLILQVKDTGIGIAEKDISKAMATFGQVDSKLSRRYEGTGLGLPLTKKLVELMGGKFQIKSELGFGTTISLIFSYDPSLSEPIGNIISAVAPTAPTKESNGTTENKPTDSKPVEQKPTEEKTSEQKIDTSSLPPLDLNG